MKTNALPNLAALALLFAIAGCAVTQAKDAKPMLIDRMPTNLTQPQIHLGEESRQSQDAMLASVLQQTNGKYKVVAQRFYDLGDSVPWSALDTSIRDAMDNDLKADNEFSSKLGTKPYVTVWVTRSSPKEHVAVAQDHLANHNTFIGYFELEPK